MKGIKYDVSKTRHELLPPEALVEIAKVLTKGAEKYSDRNWESGLAYSRVYGAIQRHLMAFWGGEDKDKEWRLHHLAHAGCSILFLLSYELRKMDSFDDRPIKTRKKGDIC